MARPRGKGALQAGIAAAVATCLLASLSRYASGGEEGPVLGIPGLVTVEIDAPGTPPTWALWERLLLDRLHPAALEFVERYTREDGTLIWRDEWPGMDGSDDGYESFYNFSLYHALGGPEEIDRVARRLWDGVTRQFTRYGQVHEEFDGYYDWMHHGESYVAFYFFGLSDPTDEKFRERALRFAGLYLGEDPRAPNWDAERKLIRSPLNGSRGPRFVTTAEDWGTHRPVLADYPLPYDDIPGVSSSRDWVDDERFPHILRAINERMTRGDVPLNLTATSLVLNAYLLTGEEKYREWILEYVRAWIDRTEGNGGILPDNVGLSGEIGENMGGRWWGGYYGWRWPHGLFNLLESTLIGASNALLLTGDRRFLELPRSQMEVVLEPSRVEGGRRLVPHKHAETGWYAFRPINPQYPIYLHYLSGDAGDRERIDALTSGGAPESFAYRKQKGDSGNERGWLRFLEGEDPDYPAAMLRANHAESLRRLEMIRADRSTPDEQDVHHWQGRNPVVLEGLVQLMLGAPNHIYHGGLLHATFRYFDPVRRLPGVPADVAALVEAVGRESATLVLVNLHPTETREVIVQGGAFGEHRLLEVRSGSRRVPIGRRLFHVRLGPAAVGRLEVALERHRNPPTYAFPWHGERVPFR